MDSKLFILLVFHARTFPLLESCQRLIRSQFWILDSDS